MKICFDGIGITHFKNTGVYSHSVNLLNNLTTTYPQPQYKIISNKQCVSNLGTSKKLSSNEIINNKDIDFVELDINRKKNDLSLLEEYIINNKINIYHSLNNGFSIPSNKVCKYVSTIHNLLPISYPNYVDKMYTNKFHKVIPNALEKSDKIIAVSNFIKNELITYYNVPEKKVEVIYPTLSKIFKPINNEISKSILKNNYMIQGDFLLCSSSIHMRKNLCCLLKAFKEISQYHDDLYLIIIGNYKNKRLPYFLKLKEYARNLDINNKVIFTGSVQYSHMPYFYNSALCTINISDYEGFPMSCLESIACNTPVICSSTSSFKEVLNNGAIYVNNKDSNEVKYALLEIIKNRHGNKKEIDPLIIKKYISNNSIKKHVKIYESII